MTLMIECMHGLGDNLFVRPYIRAAATRDNDIYVSTPWPEVFEDLPVKFVRKPTTLRTQRKNMDRQNSSRWTQPPQPRQRVTQVRFSYGPALILKKSIPAALERVLPLDGQPYKFDLPSTIDRYLSWRVNGKPVAIIRPVTVRKEWTNTARNPLPEYVNAIAQELGKTHHRIILADLRQDEEWLEGPMPPGDEFVTQGEWNVKAVMTGVASADVVVGPVGFIVPMAIAAQTKAFIIMGGHGGHNAPNIITDPRMDLGKIHFALPDNFCPCRDMRHQCNKTNSNLLRQWNNFLSFATTTTLCSSQPAS